MNEVTSVGEMVSKPWGGYEVIDSGPHHWIKRLVVIPGCKLSLQKHLQRSEVWIVIEGEGIAEVHDWPKTLKNGDKRYIGAGDKVDIPCGAKHRLHNIGDKNLVVCEVALGSLLSEEDITRYEDDYGREVLNEDSRS